MNKDLKAMHAVKSIVDALQFIVSQQPVDGHNRKATVQANLVKAMEFIDDEIEREDRHEAQRGGRTF